MITTHRVGLVVPSSNTTMETELPELLRRHQASDPEHAFTVHSARARMQHVTDEQLKQMNAQAGRAARELADLRPDVVATACLVAIMAQGTRFHCTAEDDLRSALDDEGATPPVVSSAGALLAALEHLGAKRIAIITPYTKPLTEKVAAYIADAGVEVHDALSLEVADNRAVGQLDPAGLLDHYKRLDLTSCDALVLSCCVQMPSLPAITEVERASRLPTLSAATATAWSVLRALEVRPAISDAGGLVAPAAVGSARASA